MVAPVGRRTPQVPPKVAEETKPPAQTPPPVSTEADQLVALLQKLGQQIETAWTAATKEPGGDPLVKFLQAFTGGDTSTAAVKQENQTKLSERQRQTKDSLGFSVSEPAPEKKTEEPAKTDAAEKPAAEKPAEAPPAEGAIVPSASFDETRARIAEAKVDFQASKAEAGAMLYSLSKELKLAKEAGQTPEQINATVMQLMGEFRNGVALAPDLVAVGDAIGAQIAGIGLAGDSPAAYEALALQLLDGKVPGPPKPPPAAEKTPTIAEALAAFEARGGQPGHGGGIAAVPGMQVGAFQEPQIVQAEEKPEAKPRRGGGESRQTVRTDDGGQRTEQRTRQERQRTEERRRREQQRDNDGGGGGGQRVTEDQIKSAQQQLDNLRKMQDEQNLARDLQNKRIEEDAQRRRR